MILLALQDEIKALIEKQQALMGRLKSEVSIWGHGDDEGSLSPAELERQISILDNDRKKVKALESTIAVIGTMKAGKSTTINALIGEEVLPHRLLGMTTLPTLIRHKPGQKVPVMTLHNVDSLKELVEEVRSKINLVDGSEDDNSKVKAALSNVKGGLNEIGSSYLGKESVQKALLLINDAFRLAGSDGFDIDVDKYLEEFSDISFLPTVEIEFRCLSEKPAGMSSGSLALLDTPGPNEAGQSAVLKHILSEQIAKNASMVLLVMNYTQLNTEQDSEIRSQLKGIKEVFRDRSFVVVNRFDEKKQNDLDEPQTKILASDLLNDSLDDEDFITPEEVFPVSSHYAYIVEKVRKQIEEGVDINQFLRDEQNKDFIKAAFGMLDDDEVEDLTYDQIKNKCQRLVRRSGYEVFTNNMLEKAYVMAGENSLRSALARLQDNAGRLDRLSTVVRGGLAQEMEELLESVERTKMLVHAIEAVYGKLEQIKGRGVAEYRERAADILLDHVDDIKEKIGLEFSKRRKALRGELQGQLNEMSKERKQQKHRSRWTRAAIKELKVIDSALENIRREIERHDKGDDGVLDFGEKRSAAKSFYERANDVVGSLFSSMGESLQENLDFLEEETKKKIQIEVIEELKVIVSEYESEMIKKGFDFDINLSDSFSLDVVGDGFESKLSDRSINEYSEQRKEKRKEIVERDGWIHGALKVLSFGLRSDYEEVVVTSIHEVKRYRVVLDDFVSDAKEAADKFHSNVDVSLTKQFEEKLVPAVDDVFSRVFDAVKEIEEGLNRSKKLKAENMAVISEIKIMMNEVKASNSAHIKRIAVASQGIQSMMTGNSGAL